jgi:leucine-zipper of insertion element IS481
MAGARFCFRGGGCRGREVNFAENERWRRGCAIGDPLAVTSTRVHRFTEKRMVSAKFLDGQLSIKELAMNRPPQDSMPLAALPPAERTRALARYRVLQPCVEHAVPLTQVAHQQGVPLRTGERWLARYRREGLAGLAHRRRRDRGQRRCVSSERTAAIEGLALRKPPPTAAVQVCDVARRAPPPDGALYLLVY